MKSLFASDKIYVASSKTPNAGRGVYARRDIKKDELIEKCPVIIVSEGDMANLNESILTSYFFYYGRDKNKLLITLGFGSIYNHSYQPNARYKIKHNEKVMEFVATKEIKKDTEIVINYKGVNSRNKNPLWFE